ncbi:MAG: hypothetical protein ACTSPI_09345, partial [Candidatus Heimdallarchaeaceae archaeon]
NLPNEKLSRIQAHIEADIQMLKFLTSCDDKEISKLLKIIGNIDQEKIQDSLVKLTEEHLYPAFSKNRANEIILNIRKRIVLVT